MAKTKKKMGRPRKITADSVRKLEEGFSKGLNVTEACLFADVKKSTFYDYLTRHPDFSDRIELLKKNVGMQAKLNVAGRVIKGDYEMSKWYLERKCKDEFSTAQNVNVEGGMDISIEIDYGDED